jgi:hypothetical protein
MGDCFQCEIEGAGTSWVGIDAKLSPRGKIEKEKPQCGREKNILLGGSRLERNLRIQIYISNS